MYLGRAALLKMQQTSAAASPSSPGDQDQDSVPIKTTIVGAADDDVTVGDRPQQQQISISEITKASIRVFLHLIEELDSEGCYYFLNAIANQLRYPNNHTHFFS